MAGAGRLLLPAVLGGAALLLLLPEPVPRPRIPVLLVSLDTWRADRFREDGRTCPALERLAAEAVVFEDCLSTSTNTATAHRSLFTGTHVHRHGHGPGHPVRSPWSLAGLLRAAGYETAGFTGGGYLDARLGFADGFDTWSSRNPRQRAGKARRGFRGVLPQARTWWEKRRRQGRDEEPFFLFLHSYDIHCPYWPAEPWRSEWAGDYEGPLDLRSLCGPPAFQRFFEVHPPSEEELDHLGRMYDGGVAMTDDLLGGFLARLEAEGVLDRTLLIVTSDHGESLGEHRWVGHNHIWEEQLRVPLLIRFPGGRYGGRRITAPVELSDVLPTVLDYLGLPVPEGVEGRSLMPWIEGREPVPGRRLRIASFEGRTAVRLDGRWKLVLEEGPGGVLSRRLYDLQEDPRESRDLAATPEGRKRVRELEAAWRRHREEAAAGDRKQRGVPLRLEPDPDLAQELAELGYGG